jgi:hypothetical protein
VPAAAGGRDPWVVPADWYGDGIPSGVTQARLLPAPTWWWTTSGDDRLRCRRCGVVHDLPADDDMLELAWTAVATGKRQTLIVGNVAAP